MAMPQPRLPQYGAALILEDDESLAHLLASVVEWTFERVAVCGNVDDALAEVQNHEFDALVVDVGLGRRSGINFLRAARAAGCLAPALITTGLADELNDAGIRSLGVEAVLRKPYPLETLEAVLHDIAARTSISTSESV